MMARVETLPRFRKPPFRFEASNWTFLLTQAQNLHHRRSGTIATTSPSLPRNTRTFTEVHLLGRSTTSRRTPSPKATMLERRRQIQICPDWAVIHEIREIRGKNPVGRWTGAFLPRN